jgi:hypothetical protein
MRKSVRAGVKKLVLWTSAQDVELFRQLFPDEGNGHKTLLTMEKIGTAGVPILDGKGITMKDLLQCMKGGW